jgi:Dolichyl-phosphate-mannose-protein mannosyltransferase
MPATLDPKNKISKSIGERGFTILLLLAALAIHIALLSYDLSSHFEPLLRGDRSEARWIAMTQFAASPPGSLLDALTNSPVAPAEFMIQLTSYKIGGQTGIIVVQIALFLASLWALSRTALILLGSRVAMLTIGAVYTLLPQNLAFTHQLVTEAIATPLVVISSYFYLCYLDQRRFSLLMACGISLGLGILVRPPVAMALLPFALLHFVFRKLDFPWQATVAICALAVIPFLAWTTIFSVHSGRFGYTSGTATLGWNLRSKVFFVYSRNGLEKPPEVAKFAKYSDSWNDNGGISVGRYLQLVKPYPVLFIKSSIVDLLQLARGNVSKFLVDYFNIVGDQHDGIKDWRSLLAEKGIFELINDLSRNMPTLLLAVAEVLVSLLTLVGITAAALFAVISVARPCTVIKTLGHTAFGMILFQASVFFAVLVSTQIVDQAQGRLRHPAEAGVLLLLGLLCKLANHADPRSFWLKGPALPNESGRFAPSKER